MKNIFLVRILDDEYHFIELDTKLSKLLPKSSKSRRKQVRNVASASCFIHQALTLLDYIKQFAFFIIDQEYCSLGRLYFCNFARRSCDCARACTKFAAVCLQAADFTGFRVSVVFYSSIFDTFRHSTVVDRNATHSCVSVSCFPAVTAWNAIPLRVKT